MKKKNIKKVMSVLSGFSLIGATLVGASAFQYPEPFIKNGEFAGSIVVGASADSADIVGSVDIGTSLQYYMKQPITSSNPEAVINNGYKVQKSGDKFNYGDTIASVMDTSSITEDELSEVFSDGKYIDTEGDYKNKVEYTQELTFKEGNAELKYTQDDDVAPTADDYLVIKENKPLYKYELEFNSPIKYNNEDSSEANDDWKTTTINIQGKTYTVSEATVTEDDGKLEKLTLISGEAVMWLTQNQPITKVIDGVSHKIEVVDVTEPSKSTGEVDCQIRVDDATAIIDVDSTKNLNGVQIGVTDADAMHAQLQDVDVCQIALSANEIELKDGNEVEIDGLSIDGTEVTFNEDTNGNFEGFIIEYDADDLDENVYLSKGDAFTDPVFNSWKIVYGGLTADYETYNIKTAGDEDAKFEFINSDGKDIELPFYLNDNRVFIGDGEDVDERYYGAEVSGLGAGNVLESICTSTSTPVSVDDCEGMKIIATPKNNGEIHIFEITNINDDTIDVEDIVYGRSFTDIQYEDDTLLTLDLGSFGALIKVNINKGTGKLTVSDTLNSPMELKNNANLNIITYLDGTEMKITEGDAGSNTILVNVKADSDEDIVVKADWETTSGTTTSQLDEDSDYTVKVSSAGTKVTVDDDGKSVEIETPDDDDEVYGNVFIAPINSELSEDSGSQLYSLNKIKIGTSKLDTEISDITSENMVLVGGPCISKVTAQVMGLTFPACGEASGIAQNTAIIKAYTQSTGKSSIVVAGYTADDTRRATRVLANYDKFNLVLTPGVEYKVTGTGLDLDSIQVSKTA